MSAVWSGARLRIPRRDYPARNGAEYRPSSPSQSELPLLHSTKVWISLNTASQAAFQNSEWAASAFRDLNPVLRTSRPTPLERKRCRSSVPEVRRLVDESLVSLAGSAIRRASDWLRSFSGRLPMSYEFSLLDHSSTSFFAWSLA